MSYTSWSVVFGEQPSAAKWNILGTNDSSFNDSTGINLQYNNLVGLSNPYKFRAYRNAAQSVTNVAAPINFDVETFDTNSNHDVTTNKGRYTAPVSGFYFFTARSRITSVSTGFLKLDIYKNGASDSQGDTIRDTGASAISCHVTAFTQLTAGDYVEAYATADSTYAMTVGSYDSTWWAGVLISKT